MARAKNQHMLRSSQLLLLLRNTSSSGEKPAAQSGFLPGFSVDQAESLATFISEVIDNAVEPMNGHLNKETANLTSNVANLQAMMEKMLSFQHSNRETPTVLPGGRLRNPALSTLAGLSMWLPSVPLVPGKDPLKQPLFCLVPPLRNPASPMASQAI